VSIEWRRSGAYAFPVGFGGFVVKTIGGQFGGLGLKTIEGWFVVLGLKTRLGWFGGLGFNSTGGLFLRFRREWEETRGAITRLALRRSKVLKSVWPLDAPIKTWTIFPQGLSGSA
jgi:hypothetical protein